jgi:hypothetical protein
VTDKAADAQERYLKSQGKKILDLFVKISPLPTGVKDAYRLSRETEKALKMVGDAEETGTLSSSDSNINCLASIARRLSNELSTLNRKDINWWIDTSGANLLSRDDSTKAVQKLQERRQYLLDLREACDGLKTAAAVAFANTVSNVKGLAKLYMPSIPAIDGIVTKEARDNYDVCMSLIDSIVKTVDSATHVVADMTKALDRFLVLVNTEDQRKALKAIQQGQQRANP